MISIKPARPSLLTSHTPIKFKEIVSPRSEGKKVFFSQIKTEKLLNSCIYKQANRNVNSYHLKPLSSAERKDQGSLQRRRPESLNFKNDLFKKLACKIQQNRQSKSYLKQSVLNDYYNNENRKQNQKQSMNISSKRQEKGPRTVFHPISGKIKNQPKKQEGKYKIKQKQKPIKGIKQKGTLGIDDYDMVRTSGADIQMKLTNKRGSLDMSPVL